MKIEVETQRVIALYLNEDELKHLLGHLEDDLELAGENPDYWDEDRGKFVRQFVDLFPSNFMHTHAEEQKHPRPSYAELASHYKDLAARFHNARSHQRTVEECPSDFCVLARWLD